MNKIVPCYGEIWHGPNKTRDLVVSNEVVKSNPTRVRPHLTRISRPTIYMDWLQVNKT